MLTRGHVDGWVERYVLAWRADDTAAVADLFGPHARYRPSPYEPAHEGHEAIAAFWPEEPGTTFEASWQVLAVEADLAVVRVVVRYRAPREQEYTDLWVVRFAPDGRADDFEEWPYWPGRGYTAREPGEEG